MFAKVTLKKPIKVIISEYKTDEFYAIIGSIKMGLKFANMCGKTNDHPDKESHMMIPYGWIRTIEFIDWKDYEKGVSF